MIVYIATQHGIFKHSCDLADLLFAGLELERITLSAHARLIVTTSKSEYESLTRVIAKV